jgi:hypothetical protein
MRRKRDRAETWSLSRHLASDQVSEASSHPDIAIAANKRWTAAWTLRVEHDSETNNQPCGGQTTCAGKDILGFARRRSA